MKWNLQIKNTGLIILFMGLFSIYSCGEKDDPTPDTGTEGSISGRVQLYDDGTTKLNNDSMVVTILGSNPLIADTTNSDGTFHFDHVDYGTYSLTFSKAGYGFSMANNVSHHSANTVLNKLNELGQFSTTETDSVRAKVESGSVNILVYTKPLASTSDARYIRIFYHSNDQVSSEMYSNYSNVLSSTTNPFKYRINPHALEDMGFASGSTVWIKVYGDSYKSNDYIEPVKGKHIFPNLNLKSAAAVSFIVP